MKDFALIGAAGYIAPRHMAAIKETGNRMVAALDPHDSAGVIDRYFADTAFFTEFERFDRHLEKLKRTGRPVDYISVCSPNYLHDAHIRYGLRTGAHVICEKPVVLQPKNVAPLQQLEKESGKKVYTILQLRLHPVLQALRQQIAESDPSLVYDVDLTYITARGPWYYASWKGDLHKSGGVATNIGIHFFDLLLWLFGPVQSSAVHIHSHDRAAGYLQLKQARVRWFLSINKDHLEKVQQADKTAFRQLQVNGQAIDFTESKEDLIAKSYEAIFNNKGLGLEAAYPSIQLAYDIRRTNVSVISSDYHPLALLPLVKHPFEENQ